MTRLEIGLWASGWSTWWDPDAAKVALGILLTAPYTPMLFMGEEWATSSPFMYFADHEEEEMRRAVAEGRKREFAGFGYDAEDVPNPEDAETFERSKLNWGEMNEGKHKEMLDWTRNLIQLRRSTVVIERRRHGSSEGLYR